MTLFSVLVPVFNVEKYIPICLESLRNQTYKNFEVILIDDGSNDNSGNICDQFSILDSRFKTYHQSNRGLYMARITGMHKATGKYILFTDADDYVESNLIETMASMIKMYQCDLLIYRNNYVDEYGKKYKEGKSLYMNGEIISKQQLAEMLIREEDANSICFKCVKSILCDANEDYKEIAMGEDILHSVSLISKAKKTIYCDQTLYNYRFNPNSITKNIKVEYIMHSSFVREQVLRYTQMVLNTENGAFKYLYNKYLRNLCWYIKIIDAYVIKSKEFYEVMDKVLDSEMYATCKKNKHCLSVSNRIIMILLNLKQYKILRLLSYLKGLNKR